MTQIGARDGDRVTVGAREDPHERQMREQHEKTTALLSRQKLSKAELGALKAAARASGSRELDQQASERIRRATAARQAGTANRPVTMAAFQQLLEQQQRSASQRLRDALDELLD